MFLRLFHGVRFSNKRFACSATVFLASILCVSGAGAAEPAQPWFWLSSDQIRALRSVEPAQVLVIDWTSHSDFLPRPKSEGMDAPAPAPKPDLHGVLVVGPDYVQIDSRGKATIIYDFALDRAFTLSGDTTQFTNDDLVAWTFLMDAEAQNREGMGRILSSLGRSLPDVTQQYFEASLGVRAPHLPPVHGKLTANGDLRTFTFKNEVLATFRPGSRSLNARQTEMFARALRYLNFVHPEAVDAFAALSIMPVEVSGVRAVGADRLRETISFGIVDEEVRAYPLPSGLSARIHPEKEGGNAYLSQLIDIGLGALSGSAGQRPTPNDYADDAMRAYASGNLFGAGLAWTAHDLHYPAAAATTFPNCNRSHQPEPCEAQKTQIREAMKDSRFRSFVLSAAYCSQRENLKGLEILGKIDVADQRHGYVATMVASCLLRGVRPEKAAPLVGNRFAASPRENAVRAIRANPFVPAYYYEEGMALIGEWNGFGWNLLEIGEALGGGQKGDPYDLQLNPMRRALKARHPGRF